GAVLWVLAALVYAGVREPAGEATDASAADQTDDRAAEGSGGGGGPERAASPGWWPTMVALLRDDAPFRRFVIVRSLLLVSALSPPFVVTLAVSSGAGTLSGLGGFVIASGLSALIGGPVFGRFADRASRTIMIAGAGLASVVLVVLVVVSRLPGFGGDTVWSAVLFVSAYFALTLVHTGVRVGRKTYVVDMAEGDQRTEYVAVSNSAMGVILLITGAVSALLSTWGVHWALLFLAALGILGVITGARLPDVSAG
ncbi:MAG: MFS transporter, partial [Dermatophilaceae bacterium]